MKNVLVHSFAMAISMACVSGNASATPSDPYDEVAETMMSRSIVDSILIGSVFGPDDSSVLRFSSGIDPITRTFTYSSVPGQVYLGQIMSLNTSGSYNPTTGAYDWTTSGQLGANLWSSTGSMTWIGDPYAMVELTTTIGNNVYKVTGVHTYDTFGGRSTFSNGMFTGPASGPGGPGPFGPYTGTDTFLLGKWTYDINVPKNPLVPNGVVHISGGGLTPFPNGGIGSFDVHISAIPEPSTSSLFLLGLASILVFSYARSIKQVSTQLDPSNVCRFVPLSKTGRNL